MTKREPLDLEKMRGVFHDPVTRTHSAECVYWHERCAIRALVAECSDLRETVERQRREIERLRGQAAQVRGRAAR